MSNEQDRLFAHSRAGSVGFQFDEQVVRVFPDMIARSVPGYELVVPMIGLLARRYAQARTNIYDFGCSLGAVSLAMGLAVRTSDTSIIAVDNSRAMVKQCRQNLVANQPAIPVEVRLENILDTPVQNASVVVLNYSLQFLDRNQRQTLLERISAGLCTGGVVIISEKLCFPDSAEQEDQTEWHHAFKRSQGYSELEIAQKRNALENVLQPDTEATHLARLKRAGLSRPRRWFQCFSFASYIAFK